MNQKLKKIGEEEDRIVFKFIDTQFQDEIRIGFSQVVGIKIMVRELALILAEAVSLETKFWERIRGALREIGVNIPEGKEVPISLGRWDGLLFVKKTDGFSYTEEPPWEPKIEDFLKDRE